ncbi:hypothetical protein ABW21_db0200191 [Orbilia brochopaga]|nr:hypothetical protein ABW21_db0200191 [Drechslerella brochopaga]
MSTPPAPTRLQSAAQDSDTFFRLSDTELLQLILEDFPSELYRLKRAYSVRNNGIVSSSSPESPSQLLYGKDYDEVNRTLVGVLALRWICTDDYDAFVRTQPTAVRLSRAHFEWLHDFLRRDLDADKDSSALYTLITSLMINDLGKDPQLAQDYGKQTGRDISTLNHDAILLKAIEAKLVPCMDRLSSTDAADLTRGIQLGAELNFGQLAQAESPPACLSSLRVVVGHDRAFRLHFIEQVLDVAGAAGHIDWTCARKLTQPVCDGYRGVYDVAIAVLKDGVAARNGYDVILRRRAELLHREGFKELDIGSREDRAFARVLCMGNVADLEAAREYAGAWKGLDAGERDKLVLALTVDGEVGNPAVQPTYMPALLAEIGAQEDEGARQQALQSALRFLTRVMTKALEEDIPTNTARVVERSVLSILKEIVQSEEFRTNPRILETVDVPHGVVAM